MRKATPSKLDAHADALIGWLTAQPQGEGATLAVAAQRLAERGCVVSLPTVGKWWRRREARLNEDAFIEGIRAGNETSRKVRAAFSKQPPPDLAELIAIHRKLAFDLALQRNADPKLLELANTLTKNVLAFAKLEESGRQLALDERRVKLLEARAAIADQAEGVMNSKELTEADKVARMHELFGLAPK